MMNVPEQHPGGVRPFLLGAISKEDRGQGHVIAPRGITSPSSSHGGAGHTQNHPTAAGTSLLSPAGMQKFNSPLGNMSLHHSSKLRGSKFRQYTQS